MSSGGLWRLRRQTYRADGQKVECATLGLNCAAHSPNGVQQMAAFGVHGRCRRRCEGRIAGSGKLKKNGGGRVGDVCS